MNNKLIGCISFAAGAIIGSVVTWKVITNKYEQYWEEEEYFEDEYSEEDGIAEAMEFAGTAASTAKPSLQDYAAKIEELRYAHEQARKEKEEEELEDKPYVIPPDEFSDDDEYEKVSLVYYSDGVLADDFDNVVEDVENMVGTDSLTRFGEWEDDTVFVRNDNLETDFEICRDLREFSEVAGAESYPTED